MQSKVYRIKLYNKKNDINTNINKKESDLDRFWLNSLIFPDVEVYPFSWTRRSTCISHIYISKLLWEIDKELYINTIYMHIYINLIVTYERESHKIIARKESVSQKRREREREMFVFIHLNVQKDSEMEWYCCELWCMRRECIVHLCY